MSRGGQVGLDLCTSTLTMEVLAESGGVADVGMVSSKKGVASTETAQGLSG